METTEMEMELSAIQEINRGQDLTSPLPPLSFSLHDSFLFSHCSSCFSPLPPSPSLPLPPITRNYPITPTPTVFYCSPQCSFLDSSLHFSSAEFHLLQSASATSSPTSDLRAALRLLSLLFPSPPPAPSASPPRLFGLLTNRDKLMGDEDVALKIREGAREMAKARRLIKHGRIASLPDDVVLDLEEAVLCLVMTNSVEVQDKTGRSLGIAVYDKDFSWINHSCSPNACYRFSVSGPTNTAPFCNDRRILIAPRLVDGGGTQSKFTRKTGVSSNIGSIQGSENYGPRIIIRSIKQIKRDEGVTVAYTDLLQPKAMRQSELWSRYQFVCSCRRCAASPPTYVDYALEEILPSSFDCLNSVQNFQKDDAYQKLADCVDEIISECLLVDDPESCCIKLEKILNRGMNEQLETSEGKLMLNLRLHPLNHHALNAYTTLASAYKIQSTDLSALHTDEINGDDTHKAFDMSRASAACSLLLAGATHHLFRYEDSLIASAANFWANAGESLFILARRSEWRMLAEPGSLVIDKCANYSLMIGFETNDFQSQARNADFENMSREFLDNISNLTKKVWSFLINGCHYLQNFEDPVDLSWIEKDTDMACSRTAHMYGRDDGLICKNKAREFMIEQRASVYQLGLSCLLYGRYLANICYGESSHLTRHIKDILCEHNLIYSFMKQ